LDRDLRQEAAELPARWDPAELNAQQLAPEILRPLHFERRRVFREMEAVRPQIRIESAASLLLEVKSNAYASLQRSLWRWMRE
jgi:hypothetical protein